MARGTFSREFKIAAAPQGAFLWQGRRRSPGRLGSGDCGARASRTKPYPLDRAAYKRRNVIERLFCRLKKPGLLSECRAFCQLWMPGASWPVLSTYSV